MTGDPAGANRRKNILCDRLGNASIKLIHCIIFHRHVAQGCTVTVTY